MNLPDISAKSFVDKCKELVNLKRMGDNDVLKEIDEYVEKQLLACLNKDIPSWRDFKAFWPPRYINALKENKAIVFFGAGLSLSCGVPSWNKLLNESFNIERALIEDEDLKSDPLTLAELAGQNLGNEVLQEILRNIMNEERCFSINHAALAALRCPIYVTTNYDCLFEKAWKAINGTEIVKVTNDGDMAKQEYLNAIAYDKAILFKIHGSSEREDEQLILTRRDYRYHYRINENLFSKIRNFLRGMHTLFVGFSHKDPEVSRLVEDVIYEYEQTKSKGQGHKTQKLPQFYSLQFDMSEHTPEIFAARGIVALRPPVIPTKLDNIRTKSLAISLTDLLEAKTRNVHKEIAFYEELGEAISKIEESIGKGLKKISMYTTEAIEILKKNGSGSTHWLSKLCTNLGSLASQGVYLLDQEGNVKEFEVPAGLCKDVRGYKDVRGKDISFYDRPYFQQAKTFRVAFVSDSLPSKFNGNSTFFLCNPILDGGIFIGLLFSACQVGQWRLPINLAKKFRKNNDSLSFILVDSNGICLLPPQNEFKLKDVPVDKYKEKPRKNSGYPFDKLKALSRQNVLVRHIGRSVVPIMQDDDVLNLAEDLRQYTVIAKIGDYKWKLGLSIPAPIESQKKTC
jgi:hypothetical protein